jgi:hypothetical protein
MRTFRNIVSIAHVAVRQIYILFTACVSKYMPFYDMILHALPQYMTRVSYIATTLPLWPSLPHCTSTINKNPLMRNISH